MTTPKRAGYGMPPEWAPHAGCWMAWPCRPENWADLERARATYVEVARAVARFEPVTMTANAEDAGAARRALAGVAGASVVVVPSDDSWTRDSAPTFVVDGRGRLAGVDWRFNAYGGIYEEYGRTRNMARRILDLLGARRFAAPLVLEGGAIHVDGEGTVLTTTDVVLDPHRNPDLTRADAERVLCDYLGADKVIWLTGALDHDNTGGHVDTIACFSQPGVVIAGSEMDPQDSQYAVLQENLRRLRGARDARGRRLEVVELLQPRDRTRDVVTYSPSYVNFYLAQRAVIVPVFDDAHDEPALETLSRAFPRRAVVPVRSWELARADGGIHCITQQQPAAAPR
ncbi:MAG: agmatine deiminase family protein [Actinobacteria bacterium]|nr:agmatine deiminase family protein [Actinomycetota bacterium]